MKSTRNGVTVAALVSLMVVAPASFAAAQDGGFLDRVELSVMGGVQTLNENDTAFPDLYLNIPVVATLTYPLTPNLALEGDFTWLIAVKQSVDAGSGDQDLKSPDVLAYQANMRASWPGPAWSPYAVAGVGAVIFLSDTDADRLPRLDESQTAFAINFGGGAIYGLGTHWAVRGDLREFVAFPSEDATGLSTAGEVDPVWMSRATLGVAYRF